MKPTNSKQSIPTIQSRQRKGVILRIIFQLATIFSILVLMTLILNIINNSFGLTAIEYALSPAEISAEGKSLDSLSREQLVSTLENNISKGLLRRFESEVSLSERDKSELIDLIMEFVAKPEVAQSWSLFESIFNKEEIINIVSENYPDSDLEFRSWFNLNFIAQPQSSKPLFTGIRTALLGSLWIVIITIVFAFPIGVGTAIYLEEYAGEHWVNRIIQTNINNLAGVPSIIYGMLGLTIFVRALEPLTSGSIFGITDPTTANGRTILSAGLTLGVLVLPMIIINAQESIRAVQMSLRHAGYGLGATKWQVIWFHVLPGALNGILTGTILSISRAIGETAPLVVVGASTFITFDPTSMFSKFTTLPIQIYQWTARPQSEFRSLAGGAIIALLILLLTLNGIAVMIRYQSSKNKR